MSIYDTKTWNLGICKTCRHLRQRVDGLSVFNSCACGVFPIVTFPTKTECAYYKEKGA